MDFKDLEENIREFNGTDSYPIENWIADFEDNATWLGRSDFERLIFAKKRLKGLPKLFIQTDGVIKSWSLLKKILLEDYASRINSSILHEMLPNRKFKKIELIQEYFLIMREMAIKGGIENEVLIAICY